MKSVSPQRNSENLRELYFRKVLFRQCTQQAAIIQECLDEIRAIYESILGQCSENTHLNVFDVFKALQQYDLNIPISLLTALFRKAMRCAHQKECEINSFHHLMHNPDIQKLYRRYHPTNLPVTLNRLLIVLFENIERNKLKNKIDSGISAKDQYFLLMKIMALGQVSGKYSLPQLNTKESTTTGLNTGSGLDDSGDENYENFVSQIVNEASKVGPGDKFDYDLNIKSAGSVQKFTPVPDGVPRAISDVRKRSMPQSMRQFHKKMIKRMEHIKNDPVVTKVNYLIQTTNVKHVKLPTIN